MAATKTAGKSPKAAKNGNGERKTSENILTVLKAFKKKGAVSATTAVETDKVVESLGKVDFDAGNAVYSCRHAEPALLARADIEGKRKAAYLTAAGRKLVG